MTLTTLPKEPFTLAALPDLGMTPRQLRHAVEAGRVRRVLRGVYADSATPLSVDLRAAALRLAVDDTQIVVDRTAAWLHGIGTYRCCRAGGRPSDRDLRASGKSTQPTHRCSRADPRPGVGGRDAA